MKLCGGRLLTLTDPIHRNTIHVLCVSRARLWEALTKTFADGELDAFKRQGWHEGNGNLGGACSVIADTKDGSWGHILVWVAAETDDKLGTLIHEAGHAAEHSLDSIGQKPVWASETVRLIQDWIVKEARTKWKW